MTQTILCKHITRSNQNVDTPKQVQSPPHQLIPEMHRMGNISDHWLRAEHPVQLSSPYAQILSTHYVTGTV